MDFHDSWSKVGDPCVWIPSRLFSSERVSIVNGIRTFPYVFIYLYLITTVWLSHIFRELCRNPD
jgi:hypothetical protein